MSRFNKNYPRHGLFMWVVLVKLTRVLGLENRVRVVCLYQQDIVVLSVYIYSLRHTSRHSAFICMHRACPNRLIVYGNHLLNLTVPVRIFLPRRLIVAVPFGFLQSIASDELIKTIIQGYRENEWINYDHLSLSRKKTCVPGTHPRQSTVVSISIRTIECHPSTQDRIYGKMDPSSRDILIN